MVTLKVLNSHNGDKMKSEIEIRELYKNLQNNKLMVGKEDNLFHVDSNGGVHPFRDDLKINSSTNNYKYVAEWQTSVYHSEARGMAEITAYNSYDVMGPLFGIDDINKVGDIVGMAGDKDWLYVAVDEGTNTIIYKGREIQKDRHCIGCRNRHRDSRSCRLLHL